MRRTKGIFKRGRIYWITYIGIDGKQKWESSKSPEKKDADYLLSCRKKEIAEGTQPASSIRRGVTYSDLAERYVGFVQNQRSFKTKKNYIDNLVREFGSVKLQNFSLSLLETYQSSRLAAGRKPATVNRYIATLKHMFTKAADWEMISDETLKRIRKVKLLQENNRRLRFLSVEEANTLINAAEAHLKPILVLALHTGMRRGEILGLRWEQVDLTHGFILLDKTKSGRRREIPINSVLGPALRELYVARRLDTPHVFNNPETGRPFTGIRRAFATACRKARLRDFRFHDMRHTFASHLVMKGVDITTVSSLLGHECLTMTLRYSHLAPNHLKDAVEVLGECIVESKRRQESMDSPASSRV